MRLSHLEESDTEGEEDNSIQGYVEAVVREFRSVVELLTQRGYC